MFEHIYTEKQRTTKINAEEKRLIEIFLNMEEELRRTAEGLVKNAAFQRVVLEELQLLIKRDGYVEEYKNGANQSGLKKSAAVEVYDKTLNTYSKIVKQLCDLMPESGTYDPGAELMGFIRQGK